MNEPKTTGLVTILAGIILAVIAVVLFLPIDTNLRVALVIALLIIGLLDIASNLRLLEKIKYWNSNRMRLSEIRRHPDFIKDLMRLNLRLHEVLYENRSGHASLKMQGQAVAKMLSRGNSTEFDEKIDLLEKSFQPFYNRVNQLRNVKHKLNSSEFVEMISNIDSHLGLLESSYNTIYRAAGNSESDSTNRREAAKTWNGLREELNPIINEWQTFVGKLVQTMLYWNESQAKTAKPLPD